MPPRHRDFEACRRHIFHFMAFNYSPHGGKFGGSEKNSRSSRGTRYRKPGQDVTLLRILKLQLFGQSQSLCLTVRENEGDFRLENVFISFISTFTEMTLSRNYRGIIKISRFYIKIFFCACFFQFYVTSLGV